MKVVFFRHSLLNRGGDRMVLAHAACLAENSHEVVIKTGRLDTVFPIDSRIRIERIPSRAVPFTLWAALLESNRNAVYVADIAVLSFLLCLRNSGRVLFFAQGYDEFNCSFPPGRWLIRTLLFLLLRMLRVPVFAVSDHLARFLSGKYQADATVIPNGIDPVFFAAREGANPFLALKDGRQVILLHSRLDYAKGFDTALAVLQLVAGQSSLGIEVWTVGEDVEPRLDFMAHRHFGYVPSRILAQLMSAADVFLHPSRHEGFALAVLESFACRCPVVTTQAVYFAQNGVNAMVAGVDDSEALAAQLLRLLSDAELRERIVNEAYSVATGYGLAGCTSNFNEAFCARFDRGRPVGAGVTTVRAASGTDGT